MHPRNAHLVIVAFVLAMMSAGSSSMLSFIDRLQWHVSIKDLGNGYTVEKFSDTATTSLPINRTYVLEKVADIYTSKGECWWLYGEVTEEVSPSDLSREIFLFGAIQKIIYSSYIIGILTYLNLLFQNCRERFFDILILTVISAIVVIVAWITRPKWSGVINMPLHPDNDCHYNILLNIHSVSISPLATFLLATSITLSLVALFISLLSWRNRTPKKS